MGRASRRCSLETSAPILSRPRGLSSSPSIASLSPSMTAKSASAADTAWHWTAKEPSNGGVWADAMTLTDLPIVLGIFVHALRDATLTRENHGTNGIHAALQHA
jgi:hypothetical protein